MSQVTICDRCGERIEDPRLALGEKLAEGFTEYEVTLKTRQLVPDDGGKGSAGYVSIDLCWDCLDNLRVEDACGVHRSKMGVSTEGNTESGIERQFDEMNDKLFYPEGTP